MTQKQLLKNYKVSIIKITAEEYGVNIQALVTDKRTGDFDLYSWSPGCSAAECWSEELHKHPYVDGDKLDIAIMDYFLSIVGWLPIANKEEIIFAKDLDISK